MFLHVLINTPWYVLNCHKEKHTHYIKLFVLLKIDYLMKFKTISQRDANTLTHHIDGFVQDCSNSLAEALELLQSYTKPMII